MLSEHINLERSRDLNGKTEHCYRCDQRRPMLDGVYMGGRWVCGKCWRIKATRPQGAFAALAQEKRKSK